MSIKFTKPSALLPATIGMLIGAAFFALGYTQDAPGACAVGIALAFGFVMLGVRNAGVIKKGVLIPILLFGYAAGGIFLDLVLFFDHEFGDNPGMVFIGLALGVIMIAVGIILLYRRKKYTN